MRLYFRGLWVLFLMMSIGTIAASAQTKQDMKGTFGAEENDDFFYTLVMDPVGNSIETVGYVTIDPKTNEFRVSKNVQNFKCVGILEVSAMEYHAGYNILIFDEEEDEMPASFMMIDQDSTDPESELIPIGILLEKPGTFRLIDMRDVDEPLFDGLIFRKQ